MKEIGSESDQGLAKILNSIMRNDGRYESPVRGVHGVKISATDRRTKRHWHSCLGIVAQGCKEIVLGHEIYRASRAHYTATPIDLPVISRISAASDEEPFLCLLIELNPLVLSEVAAQIGAEGNSRATEDTMQAMFVGEANEAMLEAAVRLAKLLRTPGDARVLGPLIVRELFYHLLKGPNGPALQEFVRSGTKTQKVAQAIHALQSELDQDVNIERLARTANMSRSAFFKHFKEMTSVSPIQYQKRLRLLEARRLMIDQGETAEASAFRVGYKSASQFSREYSRMFGTPPMRHAEKLKKARTSIRAGSRAMADPLSS